MLLDSAHLQRQVKQDVPQQYSSFIFHTDPLVLLKDGLLHTQISYPQALCTVPPMSSTFLGEKKRLLAAFQVDSPQLIDCILKIA